ncbi:MAG: vitamin K epoxide reductase family protein [Chloroflexi bacterium]|nr:vitamin K epoxide reductase family protein [Chloroflexota bacterium]
MIRKIRLLSAGLSLLGIAVSGYLLLYKLQLADAAFCTIGDCEVVNTSPYAEIMGIPVALIGVLGYSTLLFLNLWGVVAKEIWAGNIRMTILLGSLFGVLYSSYLTYIELFVLRAICPWCVVSAITISAIFLLSLWEIRYTSQTALQQSI